jgi:hypothetical protein
MTFASSRYSKVAVNMIGLMGLRKVGVNCHVYATALLVGTRSLRLLYEYLSGTVFHFKD